VLAACEEGQQMKHLGLIFVALIALLHFYIAWFEIFAWTTKGPEVFTTFPPELFAQTVGMAANQGIYNAFLGAGLAWALVIRDAKWQVNVAICFLVFVAVAGVFGAVTVTLKTLFIQTVPAVIALVLLLLHRRSLNS
jgi:putative membrane protein